MKVQKLYTVGLSSESAGAIVLGSSSESAKGI